MSVMKFVTVKAPYTEYHLLCFMLGGDEPFFYRRGFRSFNYIAGILLGPNSSLFIDTVGGRGDYAVEMAGHVNAGDLARAWQYILLQFDNLPERSVLELEPNADDEYGFTVKSVESE